MSESEQYGGQWKYFSAFNDHTLEKDGKSIAHVYQYGLDKSEGFVITMRDHDKEWFGEKIERVDTYFEARARGNEHLKDYVQQEQVAQAEMAKQHELTHKLSDHWMQATSGEGQGQQPELGHSEAELER